MPAEPSDAGLCTVAASPHASQATRTDRLLEAVGQEPAAREAARWASAARFVRHSACLHLLLIALYAAQNGQPFMNPAAACAAAFLCAGLAYAPGRARLANALLCAALSVECARAFPTTPNHLYLHAWLAGLLVAGDAGRGSERGNGLLALRWTYVIVMFWAGLQKALQGAYLSGQYFFYMISIKAQVRDALGWAVPAEDLERLAGYGLPSLGDGPYLADAPLILLLSNSAWIGEVLVAVGALVPRLRRASAWGAIALVIAIELLMREFVFGCMAVYLASLFLSVRANRITEGLATGFLVALALMRIFRPEWWFN